jgi:hypothetical protein
VSVRLRVEWQVTWRVRCLDSCNAVQILHPLTACITHWRGILHTNILKWQEDVVLQWLQGPEGPPRGRAIVGHNRSGSTATPCWRVCHGVACVVMKVK